MKKKKVVSEREKRRTKEQSKPSQLLYDRPTTRHMLGDISISTLIRYEQAGLLVVVKPSGCENGKVFFHEPERS